MNNSKRKDKITKGNSRKIDRKLTEKRNRSKKSTKKNSIKTIKTKTSTIKTEQVKKKYNYKKVLFISICAIILIVTIILIIVLSNKSNNPFDGDSNVFVDIENNNNKIFQLESNGLQISEINLKKDKEFALFSFKITNSTDNNINKETSYKIIMYDENNKEIYTFDSYFTSIKAHDSIVISGLIDKDAAKAKSFEFIVVK